MKRLSALLLFAVMVAAVLASCSNEDVSAETESSAITTAIEPEVTNAPAPEVMDFNGYEFRMICYETTGFLIYYSDDETGEPINDAIYRRNLDISEKYNIKITGDASTGVMQLLSKNALAGEDFADLAIYPLTWHFSYGLTDSVLNLLEIEALRLDQPWWDRDLSEAFTINGILQAAAGDIVNGDEAGLAVILCNQNIFGDLYGDYSQVTGAVSDGTWTFDKFMEYAKGASSDLDGDGKMTEADRWGMICNGGTLRYLYNGSGYDTIQKSAEGELEITADSEESYDIFTKIFTLITTPDVSKAAETYKGSYDGAFVKFKSDMALFIHLSLGDLAKFRDMESNYGILPAPKINESIGRYYTESSQYSQVVYIPMTVDDSERTGLITEALAYASQFEAKTALYDTVLEQKIARDDSSQQALEILFESKNVVARRHRGDYRIP